MAGEYEGGEMKDGGSAFAGMCLTLEGTAWSSGMSRRQWLAGLAMQALLTGNQWTDEYKTWTDTAEAAYRAADAMLEYEEKERK